MTNGNFKQFSFDFRSKEIDLIQSIINRMADNQFKVKGLCVAMLGFFIALTIKDGNNYILSTILASLLSLLGCYYTDCFYLKNERIYRSWYQFTQNKRNETNEWYFELNPRNIQKIFEEQPVLWDEINIKKITKGIWKAKSMYFYLFMLLILLVFYLPTCLQASSIHFPILLTIAL